MCSYNVSQSISHIIYKSVVIFHPIYTVFNTVHLRLLYVNDLCYEVMSLLCKCTLTFHVLRGFPYIFPPQCGFAVLAVDVGHRMKPREQDPLLCRATSHVNPEETRETQSRK